MQRASLDETALTALARSLGACLAAGDVVLLEGEMGVGKTTFTRALAHGLGVQRPERVCSPTFNICMVHRGRVDLIHVDLYRLSDAGDTHMGEAAFEALGLGELELIGEPGGEVAPAGGAVVVEWAELWSTPPADRLRVRLARAAGQSLRDLEASASGSRSRAVLEGWASRA